MVYCVQSPKKKYFRARVWVDPQGMDQNQKIFFGLMGSKIWKIPFPSLDVKIFYVDGFVFTMEFLKSQYPMQIHNNSLGNSL